MLVEKIFRKEINNEEEIQTWSLYENYDFRNGNYSNVIIDKDDIRNISENKFRNISKKIFEAIIEIASKYEGGENNSNFTVRENGEIYLGHNMAQIKKNIEKIKSDWDSFHSREYYNEIRISL